ncbi:MAG: hypothetical protein AAB645_02895 [Patescibacteria group bacterium]
MIYGQMTPQALKVRRARAAPNKGRPIRPRTRPGFRAGYSTFIVASLYKNWYKKIPDRRTNGKFFVVIKKNYFFFFFFAAFFFLAILVDSTIFLNKFCSNCRPFCRNLSRIFLQKNIIVAATTYYYPPKRKLLQFILAEKCG